jgi:hypothetical protein
MKTTQNNPRQQPLSSKKPTGLRHRGGDFEGPLLGSRGDQERMRINPEKSGSRTNKKA